MSRAVGNVVVFPTRKAEPPPFDPGNPAHVQAWRTLWEAGREFIQAGDRK